MRAFFVLISFLIFFSFENGFAQQELSKKIEQNRSLLQKLENQINLLRKKLVATKKQENTLQTQLKLLDHEMALIMRSKGLLEQETNLLLKKVRRTREQLQEAEKRLQRLKNLYAKRAVYSYKYGRIHNMALLLKAKSINQALVRLKYLKQIAEHDANLIRLIKERKAQIAAIKRELEAALKEKNRALTRLKVKTDEYLARKIEKERMLKKLKGDRSAYQQQLTQKAKERQQLLNLIATLERERKAQERQPGTKPAVNFTFQNFRKAKGKLPWPVKGKIITRYGKQRDPVSRTYIKNTDIEIKVSPGTPVRCVFPGVVRVITYLPGYGNTVIVDHGKGYYSVYSHLAEIYVYKNSVVNKNQVIGKVGESGYLGPVTLRFGIYGKDRTYNPEKWLE